MCRSVFRNNFHTVYCKSFRILRASVLSAHFFWFLLRDFKKQSLIGHTYCVSETGHFEWVFWSPWAKIEKSEQITLKPWEIWTDCKKHLIIRSKLCPALLPHRKKYIYVSQPQIQVYIFYGLTSPTLDVILLVVLKRQFELINKYHYYIPNPFFHNNTCWETCVLPRICIIFKSIKNKLFVGNAMGKMEGRPITHWWQHVVAEIEGGP